MEEIHPPARSRDESGKEARDAAVEPSNSQQHRYEKELESKSLDSSEVSGDSHEPRIAKQKILRQSTKRSVRLKRESKRGVKASLTLVETGGILRPARSAGRRIQRKRMKDRIDRLKRNGEKLHKLIAEVHAETIDMEKTFESLKSKQRENLITIQNLEKQIDELERTDGQSEEKVSQSSSIDYGYPLVEHASKGSDATNVTESLSAQSPGSCSSELTTREYLDNDSAIFVSELAARIITCFEKIYEKCRATHVRKCNETATKAGEGSTEQSTTKPSSQATSRKRGRDRETSDGEDLTGVTCGHKAKQLRKGSREIKLFACPYTKFDPVRYSERNTREKTYRKCSSHRLVDISRVKQHLERAHKRPDFYCGVCFEEFEAREHFHLHQRQLPHCTTRPTHFAERMADPQRERIRSQRLPNTRHSWYKIYRVLFPDCQEPESPYVSTSDPATLQTLVELFRFIGPAEMLSLLRGRANQGNSWSDLTISLRTTVQETFEIVLPSCEALLGVGPHDPPHEELFAFLSDDLGRFEGTLDLDNLFQDQNNDNFGFELAESTNLPNLMSTVYSPSQIHQEFQVFVDEVYDSNGPHLV